MPIKSTSEKIVRRAVGSPGPGGWRDTVAQTYEANKAEILQRSISTYESTLAQLDEAKADIQARLDAARSELAAVNEGPAEPVEPVEPVE